MLAGYWLDGPHIAVTGYAFIFILGFILLSNAVEVKIGENVTPCNFRDTMIYGWNYTGYHWDYAGNPLSNPSTENADYMRLFHMNRSYNSCVETTRDVYEGYTGDFSRIMGLLLAVIGVTGASITFYTLKINKEEL